MPFMPSQPRGDWKRKYGKRKYRGMEYASTEKASTNVQGWKTQVPQREEQDYLWMDVFKEQITL